MTITANVPDGCSLFYVYLPDTIKSELSTISDIHYREEREQWEKKKNEEEERLKKEEAARGTEGL